MPCKECSEGNYKWGETGECKYDTLQDCESANSKYNKMQPTPLGKKSYEEYEKELKEFNLSKVERVELNLIDDLKISVNSLSSNESILQEVGQDMVKINSQMSSILPKAKDRAKVGKSMVQATDKKIELAQKNVKQVEQRAKELGVNLNEIPFIKEIDKLIEDNKKGLRTVSFYVDNMESISKVKL